MSWYAKTHDIFVLKNSICDYFIKKDILDFGKDSIDRLITKMDGCRFNKNLKSCVALKNKLKIKINLIIDRRKNKKIIAIK